MERKSEKLHEKEKKRIVLVHKTIIHFVQRLYLGQSWFFSLAMMDPEHSDIGIEQDTLHFGSEAWKFNEFPDLSHIQELHLQASERPQIQ